MGQNVTLSDALLISVSSMAIVFVVLYVISLILGLFKTFFYKKESSNKAEVNKVISDSKEVEEEDKLVLALAAAALASEDKSQRHFRVTKITRVQ